MTFLRCTLVLGFFLTISACAGSGGPSDTSDDTGGEAGETDDGSDDEGDDGETPPSGGGGKRDASTSGGGRDAGSSGNKDAGKSEPKDGGSDTTPPKDASVSQPADGGKTSTDAGKPSADAGKDSGGGFMLPDLFPTNDAGTDTKSDAGMGKPGDKSGPCKDLQLLCFDPIDMFLFNPNDCFTCNGGKGCQGCAIPFAY